MKETIKKISQFIFGSVQGAIVGALAVLIFGTLFTLPVHGAITLWFLDGTVLKPVDSSWTIDVSGTNTAEDIFSLTSATIVEATSTDAGIGLSLDFFNASSTSVASTFDDITVVDISIGTNLIISGDTITDLQGDATMSVVSNALRVIDVNCTDCLNATEIEDIYALIAGDTITGLLTLEGGLTIQAGDTFTFSGDAFTDFVVDATLSAVGGGLRVVDLNCTNCIGPTEITDLTLGTDTAGDFVGTITGGVGIDSDGATTGEDIDHSLTLDLDELGIETAIASGDFIAMVDITDSGSQKITFANFEGDLTLDNQLGTLSVGKGGIGATTLTDGGVLFGSGTSAITASSVLTNGQLLIGDNSTDPALATLTATANETTITNGAGTITIGIPDAVTIVTLTLTNDLTVANGGTSASSFTDGAILLGSGSGAFTPLALTTAGAIIVGDGATDPVNFTLLTSATGDVIHEAGGLEFDVSAITTGGIVRGASSGVMSILTVGNDGEVLTAQADSSVAWEAVPSGIWKTTGLTIEPTTALNSLIVGTSTVAVNKAVITATATSTATTHLFEGFNDTNVSVFSIDDDGLLTIAIDLTVPNGGTGASTFTDGGLLLGSGASAFTALGVATNGQIPIGDGATDPVLATLTATANETEITNGAGSITIGLPDAVTIATLTLTNDLTVANGGSGASTFTDNGVLVGSGTSAFTALAVGTNGQILIGSSSSDPVFGTLNCDRSLTCTTGAGTLEIDADLELYTESASANLHATSSNAIATSTETILAKKFHQGATLTAIHCKTFGTGTSTVDVKINGTTSVFGTIVLTCGSDGDGSSSLAREVSSTTIATTAITSGDYLEASVPDAEPTGNRPRLIIVTPVWTWDD